MMKKRYGWKLLVLAALVALLAVGCSKSSKLPEGFTEEGVKTRAEADIKLAESNDFEGWKARFADSLQSSITEEVYQPYLDMLAKKSTLNPSEKPPLWVRKKTARNMRL